MNPRFIRRTNVPTKTFRMSTIVRINERVQKELNRRRINFELIQVRQSLNALRREGLINDSK